MHPIFPVSYSTDWGQPYAGNVSQVLTRVPLAFFQIAVLSPTSPPSSSLLSKPAAPEYARNASPQPTNRPAAKRKDLRGPAPLLKGIVKLIKKSGSPPKMHPKHAFKRTKRTFLSKIQKNTRFCPPDSPARTSRQLGTRQSHRLRPIPRADIRVGAPCGCPRLSMPSGRH